MAWSREGFWKLLKAEPRVAPPLLSQTIEERSGYSVERLVFDLGTAGRPAGERLLSLFASLHLHGVRFDSRQLIRAGVRRVLLPAYPFENKPYRVKPVPLPAGAPEPQAIVADASMAAPAPVEAPAKREITVAGRFGPIPITARPPGAPPQLKPLHAGALGADGRQAEAEA